MWDLEQIAQPLCCSFLPLSTEYNSTFSNSLWGLTKRIIHKRHLEQSLAYNVYFLLVLNSMYTNTLIGNKKTNRNCIFAEKKRKHKYTGTDQPQVCSISICEQTVLGYKSKSGLVVRACLMTNNDVTKLPVDHTEARRYVGGKLPSASAQCVVTNSWCKR